MVQRTQWAAGLGAAVAAALLVGCTAPVDPLERGRSELQRMSDALATATSFTFTTEEEHVRPGRGPEPVRREVSRQVAIRRPDGVWFSAAGDREGQVWYDGATVTLVSNKEKVWARVPVPGTIDEALDEIAVRYAVPMPMADVLYSSPYEALWAEGTAGGWVGVEEVGGQTCHHLSFQHEVVDWELWVAEGEPALPCRISIVYKQEPGETRSTITFADWKLGEELADSRFAAEIPEDYERIGVVERLTPEELAELEAQGEAQEPVGEPEAGSPPSNDP